MLHFVMWPQFVLDYHITISVSVIHTRSHTGMHELNGSLCISCPTHSWPGHSLPFHHRIASSYVRCPLCSCSVPGFPHQLGVHESHKEMSCQVNPTCRDAVPQQEPWGCLGLQLKEEAEIYLPWGACPCWRYCLMKMCISQTASQTSPAPGCRSAPHSGRGYPAHLAVHKVHVQMCWMCWGAPFRTICLQCREFP